MTQSAATGPTGDGRGRLPVGGRAARGRSGIGAAALRAARLLDGLRDRSGVAGTVVEVYPAAARRAWGLGATRSVEEVAERVPIRFRTPEARAACAEVEHAFDALICALVARARTLGRTDPPPPPLRAIAAVEGWIHVPVGRLADLTA